jgi:serine/threonine protein kinase
MPGGTLEDKPTAFKGDAFSALKAIRPVVAALSRLHKDKMVLRDIKPANVFFENNCLVLGDFGIAFSPTHVDRITTPNERVGPRDYMPGWANIGMRFEDVEPNFDVYMLV